MSATVDGSRLSHLHFSPLSSLIGKSVLERSRIIERSAPDEVCARAFLAKYLFFVGGTSGFLISLVETVAGAIFGLFGESFNRFCCENRSEFWKNFSIGCFAYGIHAAMVGRILIKLMTKNEIPTQIETVIGDKIIYLQSAYKAQTIFGSSWQNYGDRAFSHFLSQLPLETIDEIRLAAAREENYHPRWISLNTVRERLIADPDRIWPIRNLDIPLYIEHRVVEDSSLLHLFGEDRLNNLPRHLQSTELRLRLQRGFISRYTNSLAQHISRAIIEICETPDLRQLLNRGDEKGEVRLKELDAAVFPQLCSYAQYKELLSPISCPHLERRVKLIDAKKALEALSEEEKTNLRKRILLAEGGEDGPVKEAYNKICDLGGNIHQDGRLKIENKSPLEIGYQLAFAQG